MVQILERPNCVAAWPARAQWRRPARPAATSAASSACGRSWRRRRGARRRPAPDPTAGLRLPRRSCARWFDAVALVAWLVSLNLSRECVSDDDSRRRPKRALLSRLLAHVGLTRSCPTDAPASHHDRWPDVSPTRRTQFTPLYCDVCNRFSALIVISVRCWVSSTQSCLLCSRHCFYCICLCE